MGETYISKDTKVFNATKREAPKVETAKVEESSKRDSVILKDNNDKAMTDFLDTDPQTVLKGVIWSEILGKPRALRKGR